MTPQTPTHSLPSYDEPTPETRGKLSREEEAERALKHTEFTAGTPRILISLFLLTIVSVAALQVWAGSWPKLNFRSFLNAAEIKSFEKQLESDSIVSQWLLPPTQSFLTSKLGAGNEQVYLGRDGWMFYRPDVDYLTGPPFLSATWLRHRGHSARIQPDPVKAILHFRDQLAARGIALLILPVPSKPGVEGDKLSAKVPAGTALQNASFTEFLAKVDKAGVSVFDPAPLLTQAKNGDAYLQTDTHWRPETVSLVAKNLAENLRLTPLDQNDELTSTDKQISGDGDVARMLKLAETNRPPAQTVTIRQISNRDALWRPERSADVLVLGDSFANIFSLEALGWGESAGLVEQLSYSLGGRPLDCILRNSDGAFATREILARELARGRDRLAGKKLVIWEFAERELAFGDWKLLELKLGQPSEAKFFSPAPNETIEATGMVEAVSPVPRPGTEPYKDHIMSVQVSDLTFAPRKGGEPLQAIVYLWSMRDNVWTEAARLRPGDRVSLRLRAWSDVSAQYESINRSEIDEPALQLEEPVWGELK